MLSIGGYDLAKLTIFQYWGDGLVKLIIFPIISTRASWLGRLTIHCMGNFPLPEKYWGGYIPPGFAPMAVGRGGSNQGAIAVSAPVRLSR